MSKTTTHLLRAALLAAATTALLALRAGAQTPTDYNKRELMLQTLDQSRPNDYVPVFFNIHFKEHEGLDAVRAHVDWFRRTHVDFVNVKYEYFPPSHAVRTPADWKRIQPFSPEVWEEQLLVIRELKRELGSEALIIPTVFSPLRVLIQAAGVPLSSDKAGRAAMVELIRRDPEAIRPALEAVTQSLVHYIREARRAGADGFYISSQGDDLEEFAGDIFRRILKPYDRQLADVAAEVAPFNILHICESGGHITPATFDDYLDYPGSIINPPMHNFKDSTLTLRQISERFRRPVLGGMQRWGALYKGTLEEAKAEVDAILREAPANFIFGADDSLPNDSDPEKVRRLVDYIHTWRLTHKASAAQ